MTISTTSTKIVYQANGSTKNWSFVFPGGPNPDIHVFVKPPGGALVEVTTNFQVNLNSPIDPNPTSVGGVVVYPVTGAPLAVGNEITIVRRVPLIQPTSFSNQEILYQEVVEKTFDYVVEEIQQLQEQVDRAILQPIDDSGPPLVIPPCPERANKFLAFDENCNAIVVGNANPITSTNGVRVPNTESIPELPARPLRPGTIITFDNNGDPTLAALPPPNVLPLFGSRVSITGAHTVVNSEKSFLLQLSGNIFYDLIFTAPADYDADFSVAVFNADIYTGPGTGRGKRILLNGAGMPGGLLWPGEWVYIFRYGSTWVTNPRDTRWKPGVQVTFFVDPVLGVDDGTTDGLGTGTGASKTVAIAVAVAIARLDYGGIMGAISGALIQLAQGTYTENVLINLSTVGGLPITIKGADDGVNPTPWLVQVAAGKYGIQADNASSVIVRGLNFVGVGNDAAGCVASHSSSMVVQNCRFGNFPGSVGFHMWAFDNSIINTRDIITAGSAYTTIFCTRQSVARLSGAMTVSAGLSFSWFMAATYNSTFIGGPNVIGDSTDFHLVGGAGVTTAGGKYALYFNSGGNLGIGVMDTLPGNLPGVVGAPGGVTHGFDSSWAI